MVARKDIEQVAKLIGNSVKAERVILFGSYAQGKATEDSDVDFMIIADSELPRFKRSRKLYKLMNPHPFAMDLVVYTPEEVERGTKSEVSFVAAVLREGKMLYDGRNRDQQAVGSER